MCIRDRYSTARADNRRPAARFAALAVLYSLYYLFRQYRIIPVSYTHLIGAGPSGLTVAGDLAKLGYKVTVYEALHLSLIHICGAAVRRVPAGRAGRRCGFGRGAVLSGFCAAAGRRPGAGLSLIHI